MEFGDLWEHGVKKSPCNCEAPPVKRLGGKSCYEDSNWASLCLLPIGFTMTGAKYAELLQKLEFHMSSACLHNFHAWRSTMSPKQFLDSKNFQTLEWPGNSPDLNSKVNLWHVLKAKVSDKHPQRSDALRTTIKESWVGQRNITELMLHLISSMPR